ncbi:MAG: hypothetical protein NT119_10205, partial [Actinobacteria bacterium]|nr:hypothetical protein [Actinomycetota bacterium]
SSAIEQTSCAVVTCSGVNLFSRHNALHTTCLAPYAHPTFALKNRPADISFVNTHSEYVNEPQSHY